MDVDSYDVTLRVALEKGIPKLYNALYGGDVESIDEMVDAIVEQAVSEWWSAFGTLPPSHEERGEGSYDTLCTGCVEDAMMKIHEKITVQVSDTRELTVLEEVFGDLSLQMYMQANRTLRQAWESVAFLPEDAPLPPLRLLLRTEYDHDVM